MPVIQYTKIFWIFCLLEVNAIIVFFCHHCHYCDRFSLRSPLKKRRWTHRIYRSDPESIIQHGGDEWSQWKGWTYFSEVFLRAQQLGSHLQHINVYVSVKHTWHVCLIHVSHLPWRGWVIWCKYMWLLGKGILPRLKVRGSATEAIVSLKCCYFLAKKANIKWKKIRGKMEKSCHSKHCRCFITQIDNRTHPVIDVGKTA